MVKPNLGLIFRQAKAFAVRKMPELMTGAGIAFGLSSTYFAVKATPKAMRLIDEAEEEKGEPLTVAEKIKVAWKPYIPAAVAGVSSVACHIGATSVSARRTAALAAAYQISETTLNEYRDKVVETVGEKKEQVIREKVAQDRLDKSPASESTVIVTGKGKTKFYDAIADRYFEGDIDQIRRAAIKINQNIQYDMCGYASLNEFYDAIGLRHVGYGDEIGWNTAHLIELDISPGITDNEEPCLVLGHYNAPKYEYQR